jgi:hypothetical protein
MEGYCRIKNNDINPADLIGAAWFALGRKRTLTGYIANRRFEIESGDEPTTRSNTDTGSIQQRPTDHVNPVASAQ